MQCDINNWGHPLWCIIHLLTILMKKNENNIEKMKIFLENLKYLLPCPKCRKHYEIQMEKYLKNKNEWRKEIIYNKKILIYCMIIMHQQINIQNNKKKYNIHYHYKYWLTRKNKKNLLNIYIKNLKLCSNVSKELFLHINNIELL